MTSHCVITVNLTMEKSLAGNKADLRQLPTRHGTRLHWKWRIHILVFIKIRLDLVAGQVDIYVYIYTIQLPGNFLVLE